MVSVWVLTPLASNFFSPLRYWKTLQVKSPQADKKH